MNRFIAIVALLSFAAFGDGPSPVTKTRLGSLNPREGLVVTDIDVLAIGGVDTNAVNDIVRKQLNYWGPEYDLYDIHVMKADFAQFDNLDREISEYYASKDSVDEKQDKLPIDPYHRVDYDISVGYAEMAFCDANGHEIEATYAERTELDGLRENVDVLAATVTNAVLPTNPTFSNAVLSVGLNIDTNSVAVLNEIAKTFGGFPIEGTATTVGGLLAALAAAVAWLRKKKIDKLTVTGMSKEVTADGGVAKLDDFFTESNSLLTSRVNTLVDSKVGDVNAVLAAALDGTEVA